MTDPAPTGSRFDTPTHDRWLYAWATGNAVGGALASAAGPFVTFALATAAVVAGGVIGVLASRSAARS